MRKMQKRVSTADLDSAGSIYPLRVPYEELRAVGSIFDMLWCWTSMGKKALDRVSLTTPPWTKVETRMDCTAFGWTGPAP